MANIWNMLFGGRGRVKQASTLSPMQQQLQQQMGAGLQGGPSNIPGMGYLQQLMSDDPSAFAAYEAPALRQFNQEIVPGIAERFSGMGMGAQGSSAFQQQLASAGGRLSENLAAQRANLRQGAMSQLGNMYGMAMQPGFQNYYQQPTQGMVPGMMQGLASGAGYGLMGGMGGMFPGMGGYGGYGGYQNQGGWS